MKEKDNRKRICSKCHPDLKEMENTVSENKILCDKCNFLQEMYHYPNLYGHGYEEHALYLLKYGRKKNGLKWYIHMRDSLFKVVDEENKLKEKLEEEKKDLITKKLFLDLENAFGDIEEK